MILLLSDESWPYLLSDRTNYQAPPRLRNVLIWQVSLRSHNPDSSKIISVVSHDIGFTLFLLMLPWSSQSPSVSNELCLRFLVSYVEGLIWWPLMLWSVQGIAAFYLFAGLWSSHFLRSVTQTPFRTFQLWAMYLAPCCHYRWLGAYQMSVMTWHRLNRVPLYCYFWGGMTQTLRRSYQ